MKTNFPHSGWLVVNKPQGVESFGVVRKLKFLYQFNKIGFAGTLDPLASGLLLIALNKATKLIPQIHSASKIYEVQIRLGATTPTLDAEGRYSAMQDISRDSLNYRKFLRQFIGTYQQRIPNFSAHKLSGKNFYELARNNQAIEERFKSVALHSIKILSMTPSTIHLQLECQTGFYVRAFASELASSLGELGYAEMIKRLKIGSFSIEQSVNFEKILAFSSIHDLHSHLITI